MNGKKTLLLVNPPANPNVGAQLFLENLGLGYLAGAVRKQLGPSHRVLLWDCDILGGGLARLDQALGAAKPDYVGLSLSTMNAHFGLQAAQHVRQLQPQAKLLLGGILPSTLDDAALAPFSPDAIIRGEGEKLLCQALGTLDADPDAGPLALSQDTPLDVDSLAWPARDMLPWQLARHPQASLAASRGCPNRCGFCSIPRPAHSRRWRPRDIEDVVEEMRWIQTEYGVSHFYFVDDNFLLDTPASRARAEHFARLVLTTMAPIRFGFMCRSAALQKPLFKLLKKAGLSAVFLGIESFSQPVLDRYRKQERVAEHLDAIHLLDELGLTLNPGFIFFDPWTNETEVHETLGVMRDLDFPALEAVNSKLTCYEGSAIAGDIPAVPVAAPRLGIKEYAFREPATQALFDECVRLFYQTLGHNEAYRIHEGYRFLLGSLQPYCLGTPHEALFRTGYTTSKALWHQADTVVLDWIDAFAAGERISPDVLTARLDARAVPCWQAGNLAAERLVAAIRQKLLGELQQDDAVAAPLRLLGFTLPHPALRPGDLLQRLAAGRPAIRSALARTMLFHVGETQRTVFTQLLAGDDEALATLCCKAARAGGQEALLPALEAFCARRGDRLSPELGCALDRMRALADLPLPQRVLATAPPPPPR